LTDAEVEELSRMWVSMLGIDQRWPLVDVLLRLCTATDHLLDAHDCDHHGYEETIQALKHGRSYHDYLANKVDGTFIPRAIARIREQDGELKQANARLREMGSQEEDLECEIERLSGAEVRLRDLVRHQRGPLHDAGLLTDDEYAALAGDHGAVARLEGYDALREQLRTLESRLRRYEPRVGDRVTGENVGHLPVGTRVTWSDGLGGTDWAERLASDHWRGPDGDYTDRIIRAGEPATILSLPPEAPNG
jgi:hypothetical protein